METTLNTQQLEKKDSKFKNFLRILTSERGFFFYIISVMILIPAVEFIMEFLDRPFYLQPNILEIAGYAGALLILTNLALNTKKKFYVSEIFFALLIVFAALSYYFSQDINASTFGYYYDEWFSHFLAYFSLMYAATMLNDNKLRKKVLIVFVCIALFESIICIFQTFGVQIYMCYFDNTWHNESKLSYGLTQHNNFYAGLSILFVSACAGIFLFTNKAKIRWTAFVLTAISFYASMCTEARIAWVGNICFMLFFLISLLVMYKKDNDKQLLKANLKKLGILALMMIIVVCCLVFIAGRLTGELSILLSEAGGELEQMGSNRGRIWKRGLQTVPEYWPTGIGLDNYRSAFFINPDYVEGEWTQGKGHNEYIHTLVTQGVFAVTNYIAMLVYAVVVGVRTVKNSKDKENKYLTWIFLAMFIGYAAQACFNSSVINTAMYFWIVIGLVMPQANQRFLGYRKSLKAKKD